MKKILIVLIAMVSMVAFVSMANAADIANSAHDFSTGGTGQGQSLNTSGEICNTCHVPHAPSNAADGPLWDHDVTTATFTPYADPQSTIDATDLSATVGPVSKLCLSCHDGTVSIDAFGGGAGSTTITGTALIGNDLSNDHPVSFSYTAAVATSDGELTSPLSVDEVTAGGLPLFQGTGQMECATCHNAHDGAATAFLRVPNVNSDLCKTCHVK
ncbi:MAG: cytochrome c3 family protein [Nitrospirota bacterium]